MNELNENHDEKEMLHLQIHAAIFAHKLIKIILLAALLVVATIKILELLQFQWYFAVIIALITIVVGILNLYIIHQDNYLTITNQRIIVGKKESLFKSDSFSSNLNKVKETAFSQDSFFATLFGYGTLYINTDADFLQNRFIIVKNLAKIKQVKLYIDKLNALVEQGTKRDKLPPFNLTNNNNEHQGSSPISEKIEPEAKNTEHREKESSPKTDS